MLSQQPRPKHTAAVSAPDLNSSTSSDELGGWISSFMQRKGNDLFLEVNVNFICDTFNLTGLDSRLSHFHNALDLILDQEIEFDSETEQETVENEAEVLYGLIHARYIITKRGLAEMRHKYQHRAVYIQCEPTWTALKNSNLKSS